MPAHQSHASVKAKRIKRRLLKLLIVKLLVPLLSYFENSGTIRLLASVAKLVDALDLGSSVFDVTVRVRPLAPL